jgi:hypothetical protein
MQRQTRLAHPAGTNQGYQPVGWGIQQLPNLIRFAGASEQGRELGRQWR